MENSRRILLLIDRSREYGRGLVRGIAKYSRLHGPWTFLFSPEPYLERITQRELPWLKDVQADGIIMYEHPEAVSLLKTGLPVVFANSSQLYDLPNVMTLGSNSTHVSNKAVEHLLDRGFTSLAFCGTEDIEWSCSRRQAFEKAAAKKNCKVHCYKGPFPLTTFLQIGNNAEFANWLKSLPKPIGLMACNDDIGRLIIDSCRSAKLKVPDDVAVIGVDDDTMICELCNPPLSSIPLNTLRAGYEAAKFLDGKMSKKQVRKGRINVPVLDPIERTSTDIQATKDEYVSNAIRFIRLKSHEPLQVGEVADEVCLNRRTLERKFKTIVGRGINDEIRRVRVKAISRMLIETDLTVTNVAHEMNFTGIDHIARYFKKEMGINPSEYRAQNR